MNKSITRVNWVLNNYCTAECSYCPIHFRGDAEPREIKDYIRIANVLIDTYQSIDRVLEWDFSGGEPLDMFDIVTLLKLCRTNGNNLKLHTNGGRLWMDWWAIEPYVDYLVLTNHYWQNQSLIKYIVDTFQNKNKIIEILVPVRPDHFEEDYTRYMTSKSNYTISVKYNLLYDKGNMFPYTDNQLLLLLGKEQFDLHNAPKMDWHTNYAHEIKSNPSYTGQLCRVGLYDLQITGNGFVSGSDCKNKSMGNIWDPEWSLSVAPQACTMQACVSLSDQKIPKIVQL
jgi:organic radical activating enzyme